MFYLSKSTAHLKPNFKTLICSKTLLVQFLTTNPAPHNNHKKNQNPLIVNHLIDTFGYSKDKAISISTSFPPSTSPDSLTSVPHFLKQIGFPDTHIKALISKRPRFLFSKIDKTLKPKIKVLEELGFSGSSLADLILHNPNILIRDVDNFLIPTINFLKSLLHSNENILKAVKKSNWLLSCCYKDTIRCNIDILRGCGVSDERITNFLMKQPRFFTQKSDWLQCIVAQVEEFGIEKGSGMFIYAIYAISTMSKDTMEKKFEIYKSYGWSESDILSAFRKAPNFLTYSEQKVRETMSFLDKIGYDPKFVSLKPTLLSYSLEKRLKPRHNVLKILNSKKLLKGKPHLVSVVDMSDQKFMENYVVKFVGKAPRLLKAYNGV